MMRFSHLAGAGAAALAVAAAAPALAQTGGFNTALTQKEIDTILTKNCVGEMSYAQSASARAGVDWNAIMSTTQSVLRNNMDILRIKSLIAEAERNSQSGNRDQRDLASFQICLLDHKIFYAEQREKRGY